MYKLLQLTQTSNIELDLCLFEITADWEDSFLLLCFLFVIFFFPQLFYGKVQ